MARDTDLERAARTYAKLLRLYPATYRQQFAEPMLQTFKDMYNESTQSRDNMRGYVAAVCAETLVAILQQHFKEVAMKSKTTKGRIAITAGAVIVLAMVVGFVVLRNQPAGIISPMSSLEKARQLSQGNKDACLANNAQARQAVADDDVIMKYEDTTFSQFELVGSEGIRDVPAGTDYDMTVHRYKNGTATGSLAYEKDYGTYNYTIQKQAKKGEWKFVSMKACEQ